ncbi:MAG: Rpn family recombination-promoting nuclease/putative transposase [bacterium]|nr:Rpn family recombination-promoting nuclease/putative transposase [bacterium]
MPRKHTPHDGSYRRLFSHAIMVKDLIRRYVAPSWVGRLDFSTLEMVPAHYVSDELEQRESDVVWRLRYRPNGEWFYVYILIEFQSSVAHFMAIRVLSYVMLLFEDLIRKKRLTSSGKLPPVVPIVLYNGTRPWTAPLQVADLIELLPGFEKHLPRFEYLVIDEGHLPREELEPLDGPVTGVFQLEQSSGLEEIRRIIDILIDVLDDPELRELRRDMTTWIRRVILQARLPGTYIPELQDLQEAKIMLEERAATWPRKWKAEGFQKGRASGLLEGRRQALIEQSEEKFGVLEPRYAASIAKASEDQLRRWFKKILTATTPDDLFRT